MTSEAFAGNPGQRGISRSLTEKEMSQALAGFACLAEKPSALSARAVLQAFVRPTARRTAAVRVDGRTVKYSVARPV